MKRGRRPWRWLLRWGGIALLAVALLPVLVGLGRAAIACRPVGGAATEPAPTVKAPERRLEDQSYLTLPEWYIVYNADEYAAFVATNPPSRFPYFAAVGQFWQSYEDVCAVTRARYPFNAAYQSTLAFIGASFTIENVFRGLYETTVGRLTEALSTPELTAEDAFARQVAAEYGAFLHSLPWYRFPYRAKLTALWTEVPLWGANPVRKWERRLALSGEYVFKALYSWPLRAAIPPYAPADLEIHATVEGATPAVLAAVPEVRLVARAGDGTATLSIPRFEAFTQAVAPMAARGVRFVTIGGNDEILVTLIAPRGWRDELPVGERLFEMPILTDPTQARVAVRVEVAALHRLLAALDGEAVRLEHIYDY